MADNENSEIDSKIDQGLEAVAEVDSDDAPLQTDVVYLPKSEAYSPEDVGSLFRSEVTHLIVLGGPQACGKTTLLGSIYERFQQGAFNSLVLSWSQTLCGFERICHEGRDASDRPVPTTLHTSMQSGRQYYDLSLFDQKSHCRRRLVFTDVSGEEFEDIRRYDEAAERLAITRRADHFPLLVDGERISNLRFRQRAKDEICTILRTLSENKVLTASTHIQIVFSKWDVVIREDANTGGVKFASHIEETITTQFDESFATLTFHRVSAREPGGMNPPAHGAEKLMHIWFQERRKENDSQVALANELSRPFDLFDRTAV